MHNCHDRRDESRQLNILNPLQLRNLTKWIYEISRGRTLSKPAEFFFRVVLRTGPHTLSKLSGRTKANSTKLNGKKHNETIFNKNEQKKKQQQTHCLYLFVCVCVCGSIKKHVYEHKIKPAAPHCTHKRLCYTALVKLKTTTSFVCSLLLMIHKAILLLFFSLLLLVLLLFMLSTFISFGVDLLTIAGYASSCSLNLLTTSTSIFLLESTHSIHLMYI